MQPETILKQEPSADSPGSNISATGKAAVNGSNTSNDSKTNGNGTVKGDFPPPKTDKPRPHVCTTCGRSFARLEHLKRHERSHTKEKPFECPECTRCFARRDLLLRHQQKLHMTNTTSRPRTGRRESVAGTNGNGRVRKNSVANASLNGPNGPNGVGANQVRPRANTLGHIDLSQMAFMNGQGTGIGRMNPLGLSIGANGMMGNLPGAGNFDYRGMSTAMGHHGNLGLPKLDTHHVNNLDISNSLRTAPPQASFGGFDLDQLFTPHTTINPAALHFGSAGQISSSNVPFGMDQGTNQQVPIDDDFGWMRNWNMQMPDGHQDENAVEESSPSRISSGDSPSDYPESLANSQAAMPVQNNNFQWQQDLSLHQTISHSSTGPFQLDALGNGLPNLENGTISPSTLQDPTPTGHGFFTQAMMNQQSSQPQRHLSQADILQAQGANYFGSGMSNLDSNSPSVSNSSSMTGSASARQSSVTSMSTDSITDSTRQALLNSLNQPSSLAASRKYSQPSSSSPLSPGIGSRGAIQDGPSLPSTADIRRYIEAFVQFAHPHLPVTHIATVNFDGSETARSGAGSVRASTSGSNAAPDLRNGGQCLILGMAAIGALYEYDHPASKNLFEAAKRMIQLYLEDRRKADMSAAVKGGPSTETPLWLVQAMLLNVIYGHHCGDKLAADIASNHIAALVSLARAANLASPQGKGPEGEQATKNDDDSKMPDANDDHEADLHSQWLAWKTKEERKRCFFAIFILSSLLTTAYNQTPTIMNSEILLDLPCEESLWEAPSAEEWHNRGGRAIADATSVSFASALSALLTANQRQANNHAGNAWNSSTGNDVNLGDVYGENDIRPSTFGCLVLINALHNYIWETRSRHRGREWTSQEADSMVSHIEPALNAWQAAWKANKHHRLERPNPFGLGPLSADSIPLLDLAFVRLYVNLGRTAEAFWRRDFDAMAEELANFRDMEAGSPHDTKDQIEARRLSASKSPSTQANGQRRMSQAPSSSPRRERHLRKAAYYSADSLMIACNYNLTYSDGNAHELPIQSAICFFDCVQVMAEWVTTVQERVGSYMGVLGRDPIDYSYPPAVVILQAEDLELLKKIEHICNSMEMKRLQQEDLLSMDMNSFNAGANSMHNGVELSQCGYGSKILRVTAMMLEKAVIWPITQVMAKALETEACHMDRRAAASCSLDDSSLSHTS